MRQVIRAAERVEEIEEEASCGGWAASGAMRKHRSILEKNRYFLVQAMVVEKKHLLRDFTIRRKAAQHFELEMDKRVISRQVYLKEREIRAIKVSPRDR